MVQQTTAQDVSDSVRQVPCAVAGIETRFDVPFVAELARLAVRRSNLAKILRATSGKTFTLKTLDRMVECTVLHNLRPK